MLTFYQLRFIERLATRYQIYKHNTIYLLEWLQSNMLKVHVSKRSRKSIDIVIVLTHVYETM